MTPNVTEKRLDERFVHAWKGKEDEDCLWWQGEWWSWNRLNVLADDCEEKLRDAGLERGQRIALLLPNSPMVFAICVAVWRLGAAVAPLNARAGVFNLLSTIKMLDVNAVFVPQEKLGASSEMEKESGIPVLGADTVTPLNKCRMRQGGIESNDIAVIFSTSGTSGNPKAVPCTHKNLTTNVDDCIPAAKGLVSDDSVFLNVLPNFHAFGFTAAGLLPIMNGVRQAVVPTFVPVDNTITAIKGAGVNAIIAVPTLLAFILGALAKKNEILSGMKFVICGGDKLNPDMDARCQKYLGIGILEGYGLTECSPVVAFNPSMERRKLGTVGPKFNALETQIRDREGRLIDLHEEGVLWLKGASVVDGYFRDEENTAERFKGGWFNTGDVVRIDDDGYIRIVDRATDIIIVSGFNVYPQEVEATLRKHPAVKAAVAVGEKNNVAGELVKAFIILEDGRTATPKELMDYCKEHLAHYKVPRKIGFVTEYPLSPAGKILRRELRKIKITK